MGFVKSVLKGDIKGAARSLKPPSKGGGGAAPAPAAPQTDWAAIFAAERAANENIINQMRLEAENARNAEEQRQREEEARRTQEEHNVRQRTADQAALTNYEKMQQAAAAQAVGGISPITPGSSAGAAPGLSPVPGSRSRRSASVYSPPTISPVAPEYGNMMAAPGNVNLGGGSGLDWLRALYGSA
jgi:hypothetical protein